jgi:hypothetical protein
MTKQTYTKDQLKQLAVEAAQRHGVDPTFYVAQIEQESAWNPNAKSRAGARGLAQFMPVTLKDYPHNPNDPVASLDAGARYMAKLTKQFGDEDTARLAYNWGQGNLRKHLANPEKNPLPKETAEYNKKIYARAGVTQDAAVAATPAAPAAPVVEQPKGGRATPELFAQALTEINQGLPPGALLGQQEPTSQPFNFGADPAMAAAPQDDWRQRLAQMSQGPELKPLASMEDQEKMFGMIQDEAAQAQDRTLNKMFADMGGVQRDDGPRLPASVDRYLDKLLS